MVEPEVDLPTSSEESQTAFEGHQSTLQPPPDDGQSRQRRRKLMMLLGGVGLFVLVLTTAILLSGGNGYIPVDGQLPVASPTPIVIDQDKDAQLRRMETMIQDANPEMLLLPPPQVDMTVQF